MDFRLHRGAVITGVITDDAGDPLPDVWVQVMRERFGPDGRSISMENRTPVPIRTDDEGRYRVYALRPGMYGVTATAERSDDPTVSFGRTYYPGTMNESEAQLVRVDFGQDAVANFSMIPARRVRVSGFVRDAEGRPASGMRMTLNEPRGAGYDQIDVSMLSADGSFTFEHVLPGRYLLHVRPSARTAADRARKPRVGRHARERQRRRYFRSDPDDLTWLRCIGPRDLRRLDGASRDKGHGRRARDGSRLFKAWDCLRRLRTARSMQQVDSGLSEYAERFVCLAAAAAGSSSACC